ncbi:hypothetical protein BB560_004984 [Smittium megazygosporum]|uniref:Uncharacterized protein n=1 Tax=Smittium megazygosporum TaxID=133381 RepID=A0A2T9Z7Q5_9FUNG|nr:hypothetical protein BB560_004984 [Smittium megazygosporum]
MQHNSNYPNLGFISNNYKIETGYSMEIKEENELPSEYAKFKRVFDKNNTNALPPHRKNIKEFKGIKETNRSEKNVKRYEKVDEKKARTKEHCKEDEPASRKRARAKEIAEGISISSHDNHGGIAVVWLDDCPLCKDHVCGESTTCLYPTFSN